MSYQATTLLKFGEIDHLRSLLGGYLYLSPVQTFREDWTDFRGDKKEGALPINPEKFFLDRNGQSSSFQELGIPAPAEVTGYIQDDNVFISCFAMIDYNILVRSQTTHKTYAFSNKFKENMAPFGSHVLLLDALELIEHLKLAVRNYQEKLIYVAGPVHYRDLANFSEESNYHQIYKEKYHQYSNYFVKDLKYRHQNEWRILLDGDKRHLSPNNNHAFSLDIGSFCCAHIYETDWFLKNSQIMD